MTRPARWRLAALVGGLALLTAACSSSSSSQASGGTTSGAPSPSASSSAPATASSSSNSALCDEADALFASLEQLTHIKVQKGMKNEITADLTDVKNLTASPSVSALAAVATAIGEVGTATQDLLAAVSTRCPSASPSPSG